MIQYQEYWIWSQRGSCSLRVTSFMCVYGMVVDLSETWCLKAKRISLAPPISLNFPEDHSTWQYLESYQMSMQISIIITLKCAHKLRNIEQAVFWQSCQYAEFVGAGGTRSWLQRGSSEVFFIENPALSLPPPFLLLSCLPSFLPSFFPSFPSHYYIPSFVQAKNFLK